MSFSFTEFLVRCIVPAVWTFLAVMALRVAFSGRSIVVRRRSINRRARTQFFRRNRIVLLKRCRDLDFAVWLEAIILASITGVANYLSFNLVWMAPWLLIVMLIVVGYTWVIWHMGCERPRHILLLIMMMIPIMATVFNAAENSVLNAWISLFWVSVLHCTFWIVSVLSLAFYIVSLLYYYYDHERDDYEAQKYRGLAWTTKIIALIIVLVIAWQGFAWNMIDWSFGGQNAAQNTEQQDTTSVDIDKETEAAVNYLTVTEVTSAELEELTVNKYAKISQVLLQSSLTTNDKKRTKSTGFSDALTYGFRNKKSTDKMFKELEEEILRNPVYGVTVAKALKNKKIGNKTLGSFNPWMDKMISANRDKGVSYWLEHRDKTKTIYVTNEYRRYAATLCTLLERLVDQGVQTKRTSENWCLNNTSENNKRAGVKASYQYSRKALILAYVGKNKISFLIVGFNIHDKRPEFYSKKHQPKIVNTPKSTPSNPSNPNNPKSTPTNPKTNPTNPKPTTPTSPSKSKKDPAGDSVNKGNAQKGGGDIKSSDRSGEDQPKDPRKDKQDPAKVKPQTPTVSPGHSSDDIADDENKMNYATDPVTNRGPVDNQKPPTNSSNGDGEFTPAD